MPGYTSLYNSPKFFIIFTEVQPSAAVFSLLVAIKQIRWVSGDFGKNYAEDLELPPSPTFA
jgi:hypothetical protein